MKLRRGNWLFACPCSGMSRDAIEYVRMIGEQVDANERDSEA